MPGKVHTDCPTTTQSCLSLCSSVSRTWDKEFKGKYFIWWVKENSSRGTGTWDREEKVDTTGCVPKQVTPMSHWHSTLQGKKIWKFVKNTHLRIMPPRVREWEYLDTNSHPSLVEGYHEESKRALIPGNSGLLGTWADWLQQPIKVVSEWDEFWPLKAVNRQWHGKTWKDGVSTNSICYNRYVANEAQWKEHQMWPKDAYVWG